jgi:predicted Ser/Thr protein kinase
MTARTDLDGRDDDDARLRDALERWFDAADRGEPTTPEDLAGGDARLLDALRATLGEFPATAERLAAVRTPDEDADDEEPPVPSVGEFALLARLGRGASGAVYLARQTSLGRLVAVKLLDGPQASSAEARRRFRREAELAAQLAHRNLVPVYAVGEEAGRPYLAMKWLSGPSLDAVDAPLPPREVARLGAAVARGLHEAHRAGVVHRDVKPANVLLDDGEPVLVDFGLARAEEDVRATRAGAVPGTPAYLAPELLAGESATADARCDVYGLGATLFELATGAPPYDAPTSAATVRAAIAGFPPPLVLPGARDLAAVILQAISREPARRFASAAELADDLERFLADEPVRARFEGPFGRLWRRVRRRPVASGVAAASLAAALAVGGAAWAERRRDAAAFDADLARLDARLDAEDFAGARVVADGLTARGARRPELRDRLRRLESAEVFAAALDATVELCVFSASSDLPELEARLGPAVESSADPRAARVAWALVAFLRADDAEARARLAPLETAAGGAAAAGYDVACLRAALDRAPTPPPPPTADRPAPLRDATEGVLAALALLAGERPVAEWSAAAGAALAREGSDARAQLLVALRHAAVDDFARAEETLRAAERPGVGAAQDALRRAIAWTAVAGGRPEAAASALSKLSRPRERDPRAALIEIEALRRLGREAEARTGLREFLERHPRNVDGLLRAAALEGAEGRFDAAETLLARAEKEAAFSVHRTRCVGERLALRARRLYADLDAAKSPEARAAVAAAGRALAEEAGRFASDAKKKEAAVAGRWAEGAGLRVAGDRAGACRAARAALAADPLHTGAKVLLCATLTDDAYDAEPAARAAMVKEGLAVLDAHFAASRSGRAFVEDADRILLRSAAVLHSLAGDRAACRKAAETWLDRFEDVAPEEEARGLQALLNWAERDG